MKYHITTFGCQQNVADSERIASAYESRGYVCATSWQKADVAIINTCMVREMAEDRVYGLGHKMKLFKKNNPQFKIIVTGCLTGASVREPSGKLERKLKRIMPYVDEFLPIEEVGFDYQPIRQDKKHAFIPITNGCNNYCAFCIVPYSRGKEISRPFAEIIKEAIHLSENEYQEITLLGQNVNSYGADLLKGKLKEKLTYQLPDGREVKPVMVKHLGRTRIPTLFPYLLDNIAKIKGIKRVSFLSANPWDYSDELINTIAQNKNINRELHLPIQAGDNQVLKRMNRWYSIEEYFELISKIIKAVPEAEFSTDIIVGFPGETDQQFKNTVNFCKKIDFKKAYIARYSPRPGTFATQNFTDDVPYETKVRRWKILNELINT